MTALVVAVTLALNAVAMWLAYQMGKAKGAAEASREMRDQLINMGDEE